MIAQFISQIPLITFAGLMAWAAYSDATRYVIPNRIPVAVAALWAVYAIARLTGGAPLDELLIALALGAGAFGVGTAMFALRMFGGGDVKLLAAIMLWAGPQTALPFVFVTFLLGGLLALVILAARLVRDMTVARAAGMPSPSVNIVLSNALRSSVPFGVAIAAGGLFVFYRLMFGL